MKLTQDMIELAINSKRKCIILNDDYVLLKKSMPVTDDELDSYIEALNKLCRDGVNVSNIIDYKLIDGTTVSFANGKKYTKGIFLEKRAKGVCIVDNKNIRLDSNKEYDFNEIGFNYLKKVEEYIKELESRALAKEEVYDKYIKDYMSFNKHGLEPDPKPSNFFFDKNVGFTIIDVIPSNNNEIDKSMLAYYITLTVFGYGLPKLSIDFNNLNYIPNEYIDRLNKVIEIIDYKISISLYKVGVDKNIINETLKGVISRFKSLRGIDKNIVEVIESEFYEIQNNIKLM